jgi:hypothetical protein
MTAKTVDLTPYLASLQDGTFNLALNNDLAIDWAALNIQVAIGIPPVVEDPLATEGETSDPQPEVAASPALLLAAHDAMVIGGADADTNYGSATWLGAMAGNANYAARESYLSFDLSSLSANVASAVLRLSMLTAAPGVQHSAALVAGEWDESTITWNNKPLSGQIVGTWSGVADGVTSLDLTAHVNSLRSQGVARLSLRIFSSAGSGMITYGSQEGDPLKQPLLEVVG